MTASAFDHDRSRCVRRNAHGRPVEYEIPRTLSTLFEEHAKEGIELVPLEVTQLSNAAGYRCVVRFAADNERGANQKDYLCTLAAKTAAARLGLWKYYDAPSSIYRQAKPARSWG